MNNRKIIYLNNGTMITLENELISCTDPSGTLLSLTAGQQKILKRLIQNLNHPVPYNVLYSTYANDDYTFTYAGSVSSNLAKMKQTFPACIRSAIKNTRNIGYSLEGRLSDSSMTDSSPELLSPLSELIGDYYGFYLDPLGSGALLSVYLHIENTGSLTSPKMTAHTVLGIRNQQVLLSPALSDIFSAAPADYEQAFHDFKKALNENDKRCSFGGGTLEFEDGLAMIHLHLNHGNWKILIDMENYLKGNREKKEEKDYYRGGLGLVLATKTLHGTYSLRLGLVRKAFFKDSLCADNETMIEMLKILDGSRQAEWKPLKLSGWLDKCWYNMVMDG